MGYQPDMRAQLDAWRGRSRGEVVTRLRATPGQVDAVLAAHDGPWDQRVDGQWAPVDVVCHLRDIEEVTLARYRAVLRMRDPLLPAAADPDDREGWGLLEDGARLLDPDRWAQDRQYLRNDIHEAAAAFTRWRRQSDQLLSLLDDAQWRRTSIHPRLGRITLHDWTAIIAWHDGNHVSQLELAVRAR